MTLTFGKYKGKEIEDVYNMDIGYCKWLSNQEMLLSNQMDVKDYLEKMLKDIEYTMTWGKYKNKTLKYISTTDISYLDWLKDSHFVASNCAELSKELKKY